MFEHIEKLKREYTDKYVVVDLTRPELARFHDQTGQVKTINMNGQALVQFDAWNNIAWYDIALDYLKVVPKPEPKTAQDKVKEKAPKAATNDKSATIGAPAEKKKLSPLEMARAQGAAKQAGQAPAAAPAGGKKSTADILAAARAAKAAGGAVPSVEAKAAKPAPTVSAKPAAGGKLSTAEILAAARAKKAAEAAAVEHPVESAVDEVKPTAPIKSAPQPAAAKPSGPLPKTVPEIIAWCRQADTKS